MNLEGIKSTYRDLMEKRGEAVTLRRYIGSGTDRVPYDVQVLAVTAKGDDALLAGSIAEGKTGAIILAEDIAAQDFVEPILKNDKLVIGNKEINVDGVDMRTRRFAGELIAYVLEIQG